MEPKRGGVSGDGMGGGRGRTGTRVERAADGELDGQDGVAVAVADAEAAAVEGADVVGYGGDAGEFAGGRGAGEEACGGVLEFGLFRRVGGFFFLFLVLVLLLLLLGLLGRLGVGWRCRVVLFLLRGMGLGADMRGEGGLGGGEGVLLSGRGGELLLRRGGELLLLGGRGVLLLLLGRQGVRGCRGLGRWCC